MKIAINCIFFQPRGGGIKEYILNLVNNIYQNDNVNNYVLYVLEDQITYAKKYFLTNARIKTVPYKSEGLFNIINRCIFGSAFWRKEEKEEKFDIFHSPFFHAPDFVNAKIILTVHDLRFYRFPKSYTFLRYVYLKRVVKKSVTKCNHIISISQFTKKELLEAYNISADKISVVLESIDSNKFASKTTLDIETPLLKVLQQNDFILTVGHLEPRKNYKRLIEAFKLIKRNSDNRGLKLVIVGKQGHGYRDVVNLIKNTKDVYYLNFVEHDVLIWLYKNARLFVFPSYYEGFGFPPLEAAYQGCISAVSNISSIPEVCGSGAFYFNPYDIGEMANIINNALTDEEARDYVMKNMMEQLRLLSWKKNALQTIEIYNSFK